MTNLVQFVALVLCFSVVFALDEYITEVAEKCKTNHDLFSCGKYETTKLFAKTAAGGSSKTKIIDGLVDFVTINKPETTETLFPAARQMSHDSEVRKFVKFIQRQVDTYLNSRAISISLPGETRIVDSEEPNNEIGVEENRAKKKKKVNMLIPLVMLFKLFNIKALMALLFFGVIFIKKAILFLILLAPSYLNMLKVCKLPHYQHVDNHPDFGTTAYGHGFTDSQHHTSYGKDWARSNARAYASYKPT